MNDVGVSLMLTTSPIAEADDGRLAGGAQRGVHGQDLGDAHAPHDPGLDDRTTSSMAARAAPSAQPAEDEALPRGDARRDREHQALGVVGGLQPEPLRASIARDSTTAFGETAAISLRSTRTATTSVEPRRWWVLAVMSVGTLLVFLDDTVVNTALPRISVDLDPSTSALQWVIDAYVLVLAGLLLLCGSIGDRYGRKRMMTVGTRVSGRRHAGSRLSRSQPPSSPV
jgi:hypothetical protein